MATVNGRSHLVPCRCIVREEDGQRTVLVPWWRAWAWREHGPLLRN